MLKKGQLDVVEDNRNFPASLSLPQVPMKREAQGKLMPINSLHPFSP